MSTYATGKMHLIKNIASVASASSKFRQVLWTGKQSQFVIMTIPVGGDIGTEVHKVDQHLHFISGTALATVAGQKETVSAGDIVIVPAGLQHQFENKGQEPLVLYTVYAPAEHDTKTVHDTKEQGDKLEDAGKDEPAEWAQPNKN